MTSSIDPTSGGYNSLFPVAGVNQSSQGFRNNFTSIQRNFTLAKTEISSILNREITVSTESDLVAISPMIFGDPSSDTLVLGLRLKPNITFTGNGAITVTQGTEEERPSTPVSGMIRYNTTSKCIEFYVDTDWVALGGGSSSIFNTSGGTLTGDLIMDDPNGVAQIRADSTYDPSKPSISFGSDPHSGIAQRNPGELVFITDGTPRLVIDNTTANFAPNFPDTPSLTVYSQKFGFIQTNEGYCYLKNRSTSQIHTVAEIDVGSDPKVRAATIHIAFQFSTVHSTPTSFAGGIYYGTAHTSYVFARRIPEIQGNISTIPTLNTIPSTMTISANGIDDEHFLADFYTTYDNNKIKLLVGVVSPHLTFSLSCKVMVNYDHNGTSAITFTHDV